MSHTTLKASAAWSTETCNHSASNPIFKPPATPSHRHRRRTGSTIKKRNRSGSISFSSSPLSQPPFMNYTNDEIWTSPRQLKNFGGTAKKELPTGPPAPQMATRPNSTNDRFLDDMSSTSLVVPDLDWGLPSSEADWPATPRPDFARFSPEADQFSSSAFRSFAQRGHKRIQSGSNVDPSLLLSNGGSCDGNSSRPQYFTAYPDASAFDFSAMMNSPDCLPRSHRTRNFLSSSRALYLPPDIKNKQPNSKSCSNNFTLGLCINENGQATLYSKVNDHRSLMSRILDSDQRPRKKKKKVGSGPLVMMRYMACGEPTIPAHDDDESSYESDDDSEAETEVGISSSSKIPSYKSMSHIFTQTCQVEAEEVDARSALAKALGHKLQAEPISEGQKESKQNALLRSLEIGFHNSDLLSPTDMFENGQDINIFEDGHVTPCKRQQQVSFLAAGPKKGSSSDTENHAPNEDDGHSLARTSF